MLEAVFVDGTDLIFLPAYIVLNYSKWIATYIVALLVFIIFSLLVYQNISATTPVKENYHGVAEYLRASATPQDIVAISAPFTIYPIEYSYVPPACGARSITHLQNISIYILPCMVGQPVSWTPKSFPKKFDKSVKLWLNSYSGLNDKENCS